MRGLGGAAAGLALAVPLATAAPAGADTTTALQVQAAHAPQRVHGSDGREHVEYDLVITAAFSGAATLKSLEVRGDGRRLLTLRGGRLAAVTRPLFAAQPTLVIAPASSVVTQVDLVLPRAAGRTAPRRLTHRISYAIPADAPSRSIIGSTTVDGPALRVDRRAPIVIGSPLRGSGWANSNGCCGDPESPHRSALLAWNGSYVTPEMFAIDWVRLAGGRAHRGDGTRNTDWNFYGAPVYAVADGTVVSAVDGLPDIPPFTANPNLRGPKDYPGNNVQIRIRPGVYAGYAHLQTGSVRVRPGQRVQAGQMIGRVGNSGNTTGPHLHFGIQARPDLLSESLPFEIDRYTLQGTVSPDSVAPNFVIAGPSRRERRSLPLMNSVITVTPGLSAGRRG
ncbi:MAG: M23 family metallopeptidase [Solirubrobacteraceae bacterium]